MEKKKSTLFSRQSIIAAGAAVGPKLPPGASGARPLGCVRACVRGVHSPGTGTAADRVSPPPPMAYGKATREENDDQIKKKKPIARNRACIRAASGECGARVCVCVQYGCSRESLTIVVPLD